MLDLNKKKRRGGGRERNKEKLILRSNINITQEMGVCDYFINLNS